MPLLHQTMVFSLRLNRQAVKHARLADGEIADVDHLLNFAFTFGNDLAGLESDELTKLMFQLAQRISETANGVAADGARCSSPFFERFLRARDGCLVIVLGSGANAGQPPAINRRDLVDLCPAAAPFAVEDSCVVLAEREFLEDRLHRYFRFRQYCRIKPIASSTTSAVMSSAGRNRIERSPERKVKTPRSNNPFQNFSRVSPSGRSNASIKPRPRTAEIVGSYRCKSRS